MSLLNRDSVLQMIALVQLKTLTRQVDNRVMFFSCNIVSHRNSSRRACMYCPTHSPRPNSRNRVQGFTFIELMITVAIIGILAGIAYPQYGSYVEKTRRSDGHLALMSEVQTMERCKSTRYSYANCTLSRNNSQENNYALTLATSASTFTITATGQGKQANDTDCAVMTIDQLGARTPDPDTTDCWPG